MKQLNFIIFNKKMNKINNFNEKEFYGFTCEELINDSTYLFK